MLQYIVIVTALLSLFWIGVYIKGMLYGSVKPNKVSWLVRSIAPLIATAAALSEWARRSALPIFISWFWPLLIFTVSLFTPQAYRKIEKSDYICWLLSWIALIWWYITKNALVATIFAIMSDFLAGFPTFRKSWTNPESESIVPYCTGIISASSAFLAMTSRNLTAVVFPAYLILFNIAIISVIKRDYFFKLKSHTS